jgi:hypothetical protein
MKRKDRTGEIRTNYQGYEMVIINYANNKDVTVEFPNTGEVKHCRYSQFASGRLRADCPQTTRTYWGWIAAIGIIVAETVALLSLCL